MWTSIVIKESRTLHCEELKLINMLGFIGSCLHCDDSSGPGVNKNETCCLPSSENKASRSSWGKSQCQI